MSVEARPGQSPRRHIGDRARRKTESEERGRVLLVASERDSLTRTALALQASDFEPLVASSDLEALDMAAADDQLDAIAVECLAPQDLERLSSLASVRPEIPVILFGDASAENLLAALHRGADDLVPRDVSIDELCTVLDRASRDSRLRRQLRDLTHPHNRSGATLEPRLVGRCAEIRQARELISRVAGTDSSILILGERGTGKEHIARMVHRRSGRPGDFIPIRCADSGENELVFEGSLKRAARGTLYLDGVDLLAPALQERLTTVSNEHDRAREGDRPRFDVRLVAASEVDPRVRARGGGPRQHLLYRLSVVQMRLPPLRDRGEDIPLLADYFRQRLASVLNRPASGFSTEAMDQLCSYEWPGNLDELRRAVERALLVASGHQIHVEHLPESLRIAPLYYPSDRPEDLPTMHEVEGRHIERVLRLVGGNKTRAAEILGIDRRTLYRRLERLDVNSTAEASQP